MLKERDPLFTTTACYDREDNMVTAAGKRLSTRAIHRIIIEGLLLAGLKKPDIAIMPRCARHLIHVS